MAASRNQLQNALHRPYDQVLFAKEVLSPIFGTGLSLRTSAVPPAAEPNNSERAVIDRVSIYGSINLDDSTEVTLYEIVLQPKVRIEQSKVAIQRYVRKLLTAGQAALVNFISPQNMGVWRLTLVAKDSELTAEGIKEKATHAKRYTYLLGPNETCKTAADRFESLSIEREITFQSLINAFSVEKLSKAFFDEYTIHYKRFVDYLDKSNFKQATFDGDEKAIRDFSKKLLGRIVFLYFVQKKGWLGASNLEYKDGKPDFMKSLFVFSGGNSVFYSNWLSPLFFETLNQERPNDEFAMPDGTKVKIPFLNGGLFDRDEHDVQWLTFEPGLFHSLDFEEVIPTKNNTTNCRGFLDFLDAFNFTVHEDSPDEHTVAVDPEMLGHIFENLLEDNKDKGAFYTPKEIVHYMCQESLTQYLTTHLSKEYTVYKQLGGDQIELFGNDIRNGQLKMLEQLGDQALNSDEVAFIVNYKDICKLTIAQLKRIDQLLDNVKICDPAIGSGAFPMGLLQEIQSIKEVIAFELGIKWNPAKVKANIIESSIYGVDIEKGAVDIARLRFWLSLIVEQDEPTALPNLDYKIVIGDSLVSMFGNEIVEIEWDRKGHTSSSRQYVETIQLILSQIVTHQKVYFRPDNKDKKGLRDRIRELKLDLLINQISLNKEKYLAGNIERGGFAPSSNETNFNNERKLNIQRFENSLSQLQNLKKNKQIPFDHFDFKLDFPEILNPHLANGNDGFDIIIANPPYLKERGNAHLFQRVNNSKFGKQWHQGKMDYWFYFLHKAIDLSKSNGVISFITSRYWINSQGASKLIDRVRSSLYFTNVVDIGKLKVFDNVAGHHLIHTYSKNKRDQFTYKKLSNNIMAIVLEEETEDILIQQLSNIDVFTGNEIIFASQDLKSKFTTVLGEKYDLGQGVVEASDKVSSKQFAKIGGENVKVGDGIFVLNQTELEALNLNEYEKKIIGKYIDPNDVRRYRIEPINEKYIIYSDAENRQLIQADQRYSKIKAHLDQYKHYITSSNRPYGLHRPRELALFKNKKILFKGMFDKNEFAIDENKYFVGMSFISIIEKGNSNGFSLEYLLGILNSNYALNWFNTYGKKRGAGVDIGVDKLRSFPMSTQPNKKVDILVKQVISRKASNQETYALEQEINNLVNKLYELTYDEARLLDPNFNLSRQEYESIKLE